MLHIQDIPLRRRLLMANVTMVLVPVCILTLLGLLLFQGLRFSAQQSDLATLWPEKGPALSIQYTVSSLRVKAEHPGPLKLKDLKEDCRTLEDLGIATAIIRDGRTMYVTPGSNATSLAERVLSKSGGQNTAMIWDGDGFFLRYTALHTGTTVIASGPMPFIAKSGIRAGLAKGVLQGLLIVIIVTASAIIIACGLILSHLLSRQILQPLETLRQAAAEIEKGNLDYPIPSTFRDELGRTCLAFDHMRRQLKSAREAQQRYEKNRKELIAGISHDLSTPLTLLKGYASGILEGIARTEEKKQRYVTQIYQNACTMEKLVEQLFLFSKLDLGQVSFSLTPVSLSSYMEDYTGENRQRLSERGLDLTCRTTGRACVQLDRAQFQRVVENILENSIKYKDKPKVAMEITVTDGPDQVRLVFADHGPGVAPPFLPRLFDSFYRTDAARTDVKKGSGLGLAIVRQIIEGMNGTISAGETPGGGLSIIITLPAAAKESEYEKNTHH